MFHLTTVPSSVPSADEQYTPTDADWAEFMAWQASVDAQQPQRDPTPEEWSAHVAKYLADHGLTEVPF